MNLTTRGILNCLWHHISFHFSVRRRYRSVSTSSFQFDSASLLGRSASLSVPNIIKKSQFTPQL